MGPQRAPVRGAGGYVKLRIEHPHWASDATARAVAAALGSAARSWAMQTKGKHISAVIVPGTHAALFESGLAWPKLAAVSGEDKTASDAARRQLAVAVLHATTNKKDAHQVAKEALQELGVT